MHRKQSKNRIQTNSANTAPVQPEELLPKQGSDQDTTHFRVGLMLSEPSQPITHEVEPLYRGDLTEPSTIFNDGFSSRGGNLDLLEHVAPIGEYYSQDSAYISTSSSKDVAARFPAPPPPGTDHSYLYEIQSRRKTVTVADALKPLVNAGRIHPEDFAVLRGELEKAFRWKIKPSEIAGYCGKWGRKTFICYGKWGRKTFIC